MFDPYLSDSLTQKYAATDKPHVRMTERCIAPEMLTGIQWVTATHAHTDHLDGETLRGLAVGSPGYMLVLPGLAGSEGDCRSGLRGQCGHRISRCPGDGTTDPE